MKIRWHGGNSVSLRGTGYRVVMGLLDTESAKPTKVGKEDLLILPYKLATYTDDVQKGATKQEPFIIDGAGEYSYNGATVQVKSVKRSDGIRTHLVSISVEKMLIVSLGDLDRDLEGSETDFIGTPDVLFVPVGGTGVLDHNQAAKVANMVEPRVLIPMNYNSEDTAPEKAGVEEFLKEYGSEVQPEGEVTLKKGELPSDTTDVRVLNIDLK